MAEVPLSLVMLLDRRLFESLVSMSVTLKSSLSFVSNVAFSGGFVSVVLAVETRFGGSAARRLVV